MRRECHGRRAGLLIADESIDPKVVDTDLERMNGLRLPANLGYASPPLFAHAVQVTQDPHAGLSSPYRRSFR